MTGASEKPISVLITDDDPQCREALGDIVRGAGYQTILAADGQEAVDVVQRESVDLALLDHNMPKLTGLEALQLMRQLNAALPVILVTADATAELMRRAFQASAYSVIPKPVSKQVVLYTVVRALVRVTVKVQAPPGIPTVTPGDQSREGRAAE